MKLISIQRDQMQHAKSKCSVVYLDFPFQHLQQNKLTKTVLLSSEILGRYRLLLLWLLLS